MNVKSMLLKLVGPVFVVLVFAEPLFATAQWSRKYKTPCTTCHTVFPRLNWYGEQFKWNGYQDPDKDERDGDEQGKTRINDRLVIDQLGNFLGVRLNLEVVSAKDNALVVDGERRWQTNIGRNPWVQLFVAGSIYKNVSIFIENEFEQDGFKFSWYNVTFTNLKSSAVNLEVGNLAPTDFMSYSARLRQLSFGNPVLSVRASDGGGEDSANVRQAQAGIQYYGYKGPMLWFGGVSQGRHPKDPNQFKNYWGGLRFTVTDEIGDSLVGTNVSFMVYRGTDTANTAVEQIENPFTRYLAGFNIRYRENLDIQTMYIHGEDDNWFLESVDRSSTFDGVTVVASYFANQRWFPVVRWDYVSSDEASTIELNNVTGSVSYLLRENMRLGVNVVADLKDREFKNHQFLINIRAMF